MSIVTQTTEDLTRWNRAGLSHLEYVDGNAATYLEDLRLALRIQFADDEDILSWLGENLSDKNLRAWQTRLLEQYGSPRRDYAWEILRTFARSTHVLTQTINAYSNERYIRTATQWDNLRRLVNMLDYHPAPPASAETWLALTAKVKDAAIGTLHRGFAVQNQPTDGSSPLIFETLQDLKVDYRLNELCAPGYNRSTESLAIPAQNGVFTYTMLVMPDALSVGDRAIISYFSSAAAVEIHSISASSIQLKVIEQNFTATSWPLADVQLQLAASWQNAPRLNGANVIQADKANNTIATGNMLAYGSGSSWNARKVLGVDGDRIQLDGSTSNGSSFYQTVAVSAQYANGLSRFVLPRSRMTSAVWTISGTSTGVSTQNDTQSSPQPLYDFVSGDVGAKVFYLASGTPSSFSVANTSPAPLQFSGKPGDISSGDWVLLQTANGETHSYQVASVETFEGGYCLTVSGTLASSQWVLAQGRFKTLALPVGYNQNTTPVYDHATDTNCQLLLTIHELPEAFTVGRTLWVVGPTDRQVVTVRELISQDNGELRISVKPTLKNLSLPRYATIIYANVTKAGHGETRGQSVLGNGNRILQNQEFTYAKTGLAFEQDTDFASGVRAAVRITVDDRDWTQVESLRDSEAADTDFTTELDEDGQLVVRFGDGVHGQRLPTGTNNVVIQARFGSGVAGNLPAGSLNKLKKPHPLVDGVLQPVNASGGGDLEETESLRELAPASVLTLERAVSVADYGYIAQRHASIWQAYSYALPDTPRSTDRVEVVLVPDGGGDLGDLKVAMKTYLEHFSRPGVLVSIARYEAILLELKIKLRIDITAFDGDKIAEDTRLAVLNAFSLQNSKLGESLYLSRVYQVVEAVEGVENADVLINHNGFIDETQTATTPGDVFYGDDHTVRRITPTKRQVIYLNSNLLAPQISWEAFDA